MHSSKIKNVVTIKYLIIGDNYCYQFVLLHNEIEKIVEYIK
jgi:hypothetical protein